MTFSLTYLLAPFEENDRARSPHTEGEPRRQGAVHHHTAIPDTELIARVRQGDRAALGIIHETHWGGLIRYANRLTGASETAPDIVQDVFLSIWTQHERWTVHGSIAAHLYSAVRGRALHALRHNRVVEAHTLAMAGDLLVSGGATPTDAPDDEANVAQLLAIVEEVLTTLPARAREAFLLYREHGLDLADVAKTMGTSVGTAKVHIRRAVAALRTALAPYLEP